MEVYAGTLLREWRKDRGIKVNTLARQVGCSPAYVRMMENGTRLVSRDVGLILLGKVGIEVDFSSEPIHVKTPDGEEYDLLGVSGNRRTNTRRDDILMRIAESLERIANALEKD
jgi:transcriptional regulator with XRE-family HTH domain